MPVFKCSRCGKRTHTFASMSKHARTHKFTRSRTLSSKTAATHLTKSMQLTTCPRCGLVFGG